MSTEIYCSRFRDGKPIALHADALEKSFSGHIVGKEASVMLLQFGDPSEPPMRLQVFGSTDDLTSFAVERPVEDLRLYQALLRVLQYEGTVVFAPGSQPVVAGGRSSEHIPEDMVSSLGVPAEVASAHGLRDALFTR